MTPVLRCTFCGQEFAVAKHLLRGAGLAWLISWGRNR